MNVIQKMNQEIHFRLKWLLIKLEHFIAYDWSRQLLESLKVKNSFTIACNACLLLRANWFMLFRSDQPISLTLLTICGSRFAIMSQILGKIAGGEQL